MPDSWMHFFIKNSSVFTALRLYSLGCGHTREKGCAVLAAVKAGEIPRSRHESYVRLFQELKDLRAWNGRGTGKTV